ncbi:restriction endonuclease subunit S [Nonomuraea roseoviolacea]|uniref:Type I restriction enzyme S subunit n=1 Tax=Nonomuraea roseoviolacea subsp. carminata TaxID=160689 RepID=A0ABT1K291_9ACTN|nr:restriction endonuclease subunit S [Nonomuraea roseoviolacea]MCP2347601.1 type I restriction enzyme S subunit [Nonomuraea roseoviolacea subsp. carminata]
MIAGKHIESGKVSWSSCDHLSWKRYRESPEIALRPGDVIVSKDGTIGRVARIDELPAEATLNGTMMLVRPKSQLNYRYLYHVLSSRAFQALVNERTSGSSIPHLFQRDIVNLPIKLPSTSEQWRIAEILDAFDDKIHAASEMPKKHAALKERLIDQLLASEGTIPHVSLESCAPQDRPFLKAGPFGSSLKGSDWVEAGTPVVTIAALIDGAIDPGELYFVTGSKASSLSAYRLFENDILFSRVADVGRSAVVRKHQEGWIMSSNLMRIAVNSRQMNPDFLQIVIAGSSGVREQIRRLTNSSGREVINDRIVRHLLFPRPPIGGQLRIVNIVREFDNSQEIAVRIIEKLKLAKHGLMEDLLTGRVRVDAAEAVLEDL